MLYISCQCTTSYFRLHGSYEALKYGTLLDGIADLTGGISESIPLKNEATNCDAVIENLLKMTSVVTCKSAPAAEVSFPGGRQVGCGDGSEIDGINGEQMRKF